MQRTIYSFKLEVVLLGKKDIERLQSLEDDFIEAINYTMKMGLKDRKIDCKQEHKVLYLDSYEYHQELHIINMKFISARYNASRNTIDTITMKSKGRLKGIKDGDEEINHICIKFVEPHLAVCLYESNFFGIGMAKIVYYLEKYIKDYHRVKKDNLYYNIVHKNIVSSDFLESLKKAKRIKAVTLTVDQEDLSVSEMKYFSGRGDLSSDVNILLKPAAEGFSIMSDTVKDFYKTIYQKDKKVKRITVEADGSNKEFIRFDTDIMKEKITVDVNGTNNNEVDTNSIYKIFLDEVENI
jgi:hypothetical protein